MKKGKRIVAVSFAATSILLLTALVGSSFYLLDFALTPKYRTDDEAFERLKRHTPDDALTWVDSVRREEHLRDTIITLNGQTAHAWFMAASSPTNATALLVHGYKETGLSMLHIAYLYHHRMGLNVVMPDLPGHGRTPGEYIGMACKRDCEYVKQWVAVADSMFKGDSTATRMVLHGISMGAATVMNISGESMRECVRCLVEDCGYSSAWDEFSHELREMFGLPTFPLLHVTSALSKVRYGWSFGEVSCVDHVAKCTLPMLFIHGDKDDFVPTRMVHQLYAAKPQPKQLWLSTNSEHAQAFHDHPDEYEQQICAFVSQWL